MRRIGTCLTGEKTSFLTCLDYANFLTVIILEYSTRSWGIRCGFVEVELGT